MNWSNLAEFAAMGGYGLYVWGAFGVTAVVMLGEMLALRGRRKALLVDDDPAVDDTAPRGAGYSEGRA
jgi:heme exporter protein D